MDLEYFNTKVIIVCGNFPMKLHSKPNV